MLRRAKRCVRPRPSRAVPRGSLGRRPTPSPARRRRGWSGEGTTPFVHWSSVTGSASFTLHACMHACNHTHPSPPHPHPCPRTRSHPPRSLLGFRLPSKGIETCRAPISNGVPRLLPLPLRPPLHGLLQSATSARVHGAILPGGGDASSVHAAPAHRLGPKPLGEVRRRVLRGWPLAKGDDGAAARGARTGSPPASAGPTQLLRGRRLQGAQGRRWQKAHGSRAATVRSGRVLGAGRAGEPLLKECGRSWELLSQTMAVWRRVWRRGGGRDA